MVFITEWYNMETYDKHNVANAQSILLPSPLDVSHQILQENHFYDFDTVRFGFNEVFNEIPVSGKVFIVIFKIL